MKLLFLLTLTLISTQLVNKAQENDLSTELLKGKVKSCTVTLFMGNTTEGNKKNIFVQKIKTEYNQKGYKTQVTDIDEWGNIKKVYDYKYDNKGELIRENSQERKTILKEKDGGRTERYVSQTGLISLRKYNAKNYLLERITKDKDGKILSKTLIINDNNGNIIKEEGFNSSDKLIQTIIRQYDKYNNEIEMAIFDSSNHKEWVITHKYSSENGPLIEKKSVTLTKRGNIEYPTVTKYSNSDKYNNWLQSIKINNASETIINIREIEYY